MKYRDDLIIVILFFFAASVGLTIFFAIKGWWPLAFMFAISAGFSMTALQHFKP